jgi:F-type H+-transporting ATPase subunit b
MFQVINFLVLVFLLRRFLYGPIIEMMEEREMKIVQREEVAAAKESEAEDEARAYQQKVAALRNRDEELLAEAKDGAENERRMLLESTRREVDETRKRWHHELRNRVGSQACLIARQCLRDLADIKLETMIWDVFLQKLEQLSPEEFTLLLQAFSQEKRVIVNSSFKPTEERLQGLSTFLEEHFEQNVQLTHQTNSELICGIELEVGGYRVAWSVDEYLDGVEKEILGHLHQPEKEASLDAEAGL